MAVQRVWEASTVMRKALASVIRHGVKSSSAPAKLSVTGDMQSSSSATKLSVLGATDTLQTGQPWVRDTPFVESQASNKTQMVFLGCPGVGKGTYATRLSKLLDVPHISVGDLVRDEIRQETQYSAKMRAAMSEGQLLPDDLIVGLLSRRLAVGAQQAESGFILDGFPRTTRQATLLEGITKIDLVVNLRLREDVLLSKCLGRRTCSECGGNFNMADINVPGDEDGPRIVMPPLLPPSGCDSKMLRRVDDTEAVIKKRLEVFRAESLPVENFYRERDLLIDFDVGGGIPETWPRLLEALNLSHLENDEVPHAA